MKLKVKRKSDQVFIYVKLTSGEQISSRELDVLSTHGIRGFLKPLQYAKKTITYIAPDCISMEQYLQKAISEYEFNFIMKQMVTAIGKIENNNLMLANLCFDMQYVYVNQATKEVLFIYLPILQYSSTINVIGFMNQFISLVKMIGNVGLITEYKKFFADVNQSVLKQIEVYIEKQSGVNNRPFRTPTPIQEEGTTILHGNSYGNETGILEEEETALLAMVSNHPGVKEEPFPPFQGMRYPSLLRVSTGETIELSKPVYRFGTERRLVDYCITNNNIVSRSHADIIVRGNRFYVYDHASTNHTYINNTVIPPKAEIEFYDGNTLRFATEEFVFHR